MKRDKKKFMLQKYTGLLGEHVLYTCCTWFALRIHRACISDRADTILSQDTSSTGKRVKESLRNRCPPIVQVWCTLLVRHPP